MNKLLGDEDAFAVDLLLDRGNMMNSNDNGPTFVPSVSDSVATRIGAAETLLRLLAQMPAGDVPAGLAKRTTENIWNHPKMAQRPGSDSQDALMDQGPQPA